jgi:hypothetical protein
MDEYEAACHGCSRRIDGSAARRFPFTVWNRGPY